MTTLEKLNYISSLIKDDKFTEREKLSIIKNLVKTNSNEIERIPRYSLLEIQEQVKEITGISIDEMNVKKRNPEIVQARQFSHYKARNFTIEPLAYIGFYFGRKDHATVLHSCRVISGLLEVDRKFRDSYGSFLNI